jgi:hypothetical protein
LSTKLMEKDALPNWTRRGLTTTLLRSANPERPIIVDTGQYMSVTQWQREYGRLTEKRDEQKEREADDQPSLLPDQPTPIDL